MEGKANKFIALVPLFIRIACLPVGKRVLVDFFFRFALKDYCSPAMTTEQNETQMSFRARLNSLQRDEACLTRYPEKISKTHFMASDPVLTGIAGTDLNYTFLRSFNFSAVPR